MKRVILSMFLVVFFAGCTKRIDTPEGVHNSLRMSATQSDFISNDSTSVGTRATETAFQNGDAIGVYLHTSAAVGTSGNHSSNMKYITNNAGGAWQAASSLSEALVTGTTYYATGYSPYLQGVVNGQAVPHAIKADQSAALGSTATALESSDFMVSKADVRVSSPQLAEVNFQFSHVLTKLVVSVGVPSSIENMKVLGVKSVTIKNLQSKCNINLATSAIAVVANSVVDVTPRLIWGSGAAGDVSKWEAILVPQTVPVSTELIKIICDMEGGTTKDLTYTIPAATPLVLNSGKKLTLTLSSSADLAFTSAIDLIDGEPKTDLPLTIKALAGTNWTLSSAGSWLTLSTAAAGAYSDRITGTGTGANQTIYVKVEANNSVLTGYAPREAVLTLLDDNGAAMTYKVVQNYTRFDAPAATWSITAAGEQSKAIDGFATNQLWSATPADVTAGLGLKLATSATIAEGVLTAPYDGIGALAANTLFMQIASTNNGNAARTGKVTMEIKDSNPRRFVEIPVTQAAPALSDFTVGVASYSGTAAQWSSGNKAITPANGLQWSVTGDTELSITPSGTQNAASSAVSVAVAANNTNAARTLKFSLNYGALDGVLKTDYTVVQAAPIVALSATTQDVTAATTSAKFSVVTSSNQQGVIYTPTAGANATSISVTGEQTIDVATNYSKEITVNFAANTANISRKIIATVTYGGGVVLAHTITQASAGPPTVTIAGTKWTMANLTGDAGKFGDAANIKVADNPQDYGMFFKWAATFVYGRASSATEGAGFANGNYTLGSSTQPTTPSKGYDYVGLNGPHPGDPCQKLGSSYKTPTSAQIKAMYNSGKSTWQTYNGVYGYFFGPKATQCTNTVLQDGCLFFPAAGYRYAWTGSLDNQGSGGYYWSSSVYNANRGWNLNFSSGGGIYPEYYNYRSYGLSVRCVQE